MAVDGRARDGGMKAGLAERARAMCGGIGSMGGPDDGDVAVV